MSRSSSQISASQVTILQALAKSPKGLTTAGLREAVGSGVAVNSGTIGPVFREILDHYPDSLYGLGLVKPDKREGEDHVWQITPRGTKVADTVRTRKVVTGVKVSPKVLDAAVKRFRPTRTYGIELYTDDDLREIRKLLPGEYQDVGTESLLMQILSRRKQGAFTDDADRVRRAVTKAVKDFGPGGAIKAVLTKAQVEELNALLA
jgi:hypothetical protein